MRRCVAFAKSKGRRCLAEAIPDFDTCIVHTSKHTLLAAIQALRAFR